MAFNNPYSQYKQNSVMTASPQELTLMLYNGALKFLKQAMMAKEQNNIELTHNSIIRVQDIILEFMSTVDRNYEIGENLYHLYEYMKHSLEQANIKKDVEKMQEVYDMITELRDNWQEAMEIVKKGK